MAIELETSSRLMALVRIKYQYGQEVIMPVCETAKEFASIAGTKLLTTQTCEAMKRLGYVIEVEQTLPRTL